MKTTSKKPKTPASPDAETSASLDLQEQIRQRAYDLYEQSGRAEGRDLEHWLRAEQEIAAANQLKPMT